MNIADIVGNAICSGMLVQDPNKRNDVDEIFNQARQLGGVEGPMENLRPSSSRSFTGTGRLLSGEAVPAPAAPEQPQNVVHNIVFWRNGFSVNDGPLRRLDDPENTPFLEVNKNISVLMCVAPCIRGLLVSKMAILIHATNMGQCGCIVSPVDQMGIIRFYVLKEQNMSFN